MNRAGAGCGVGVLVFALLSAAAAQVAPPPPAPPVGGQPAPVPPAPVPGQATKKPAGADHRQVVRAVVDVFPRLHVSRHPVDDLIAKRTLDGLLRQLDPMKMYFNAADVQRFRRGEELLDNQLKQGDTRLADDVFAIYRKRVAERLAWVEELIDLPHDLSADEQFTVAADAADYAADEPQARERWRKRIKYDLLKLKAGGVPLAEAKRQTLSTLRAFGQGQQQADADDQLNILLNCFTAAFDSRSTYTTPHKVADNRVTISQSLVGIGASLKLDDGQVEIVKLIAGGPADRDGRLAEGDRIVGVGQGESGDIVDVSGKKLADTVNLIRGKLGTTVRLRIISPGQFEAKIHALKRDKIVLSTVRGAVVSGESLPEGRAGKIGYVHVPPFYLEQEPATKDNQPPKVIRSTTSDVRALLLDFKKQNVAVVVLDLRNNSGGILQEAINLPGLFVGRQPTVLVRDGAGNVNTYQPQDAQQVWDGPVVVLTGRQSAGGAEIVAAALQDFGRAVIVGDPTTHGMGTVRSHQDIGRLLVRTGTPPNLGQLLVVVQKFYRPSGQSMQLAGVAADVTLPSMLAEVDQGAAANPYELEADLVPAATFTKWTQPVTGPLIKTLAERSAERVAKSEYFQQVTRQIEDYRRRKDRKTVSLNENAYLADLKQVPAAPVTKDAATLPGIDAVKLNGYTREVLAIALDHAARAMLPAAVKDYSASRFPQAIEGFQAAIAADPGFAPARHQLAWLLSTCPQGQHRDGKLAVEHAQRACELAEWGEWGMVLTLSLAHAQAGQFDEAKKHLAAALEKAPENQRAAYQFLQQRFEQKMAYPLPQ